MWSFLIFHAVSMDKFYANIPFAGDYRRHDAHVTLLSSWFDATKKNIER